MYQDDSLQVLMEPLQEDAEIYTFQVVFDEILYNNQDILEKPISNFQNITVLEQMYNIQQKLNDLLNNDFLDLNQYWKLKICSVGYKIMSYMSMPRADCDTKYGFGKQSRNLIEKYTDDESVLALIQYSYIGYEEFNSHRAKRPINHERIFRFIESVPDLELFFFFAISCASRESKTVVSNGNLWFLKMLNNEFIPSQENNKKLPCHKTMQEALRVVLKKGKYNNAL